MPGHVLFAEAMIVSEFGLNKAVIGADNAEEQGIQFNTSKTKRE